MLIDPPSYAGFKLQVNDDGNSLVLELGQERECFNRKWIKEEVTDILTAKKNSDSCAQSEKSKAASTDTDDKLKKIIKNEM